MIQEILVIFIFVAAIFYLGRLVVKTFHTKSVCSSGCGKCAVDFSKLEEQIKDKGLNG